MTGKKLYLSKSSYENDSRNIFGMCGPYEYFNESICTPCPQGHQCDGVAKIECGEGKYQNQTGSKNSMTCKTCELGTYAPKTGSVDCLESAEGYYVDTRGASGQLESSPGYYVNTIGASGQTPCPAGTYTNQSGQITCEPAPPGYKTNASNVSIVACNRMICKNTDGNPINCYKDGFDPDEYPNASYSSGCINKDGSPLRDSNNALVTKCMVWDGLEHKCYNDTAQIDCINASVTSKTWTNQISSGGIYGIEDVNKLILNPESTGIVRLSTSASYYDDNLYTFNTYNKNSFASTSCISCSQVVSDGTVPIAVMNQCRPLADGSFVDTNMSLTAESQISECPEGSACQGGIKYNCSGSGLYQDEPGRGFCKQVSDGYYATTGGNNEKIYTDCNDDTGNRYCSNGERKSCPVNYESIKDVDYKNSDMCYYSATGKNMKKNISYDIVDAKLGADGFAGNKELHTNTYTSDCSHIEKTCKYGNETLTEEDSDFTEENLYPGKREYFEGLPGHIRGNKYNELYDVNYITGVSPSSSHINGSWSSDTKLISPNRKWEAIINASGQISISSYNGLPTVTNPSASYTSLTLSIDRKHLLVNISGAPTTDLKIQKRRARYENKTFLKIAEELRIDRENFSIWLTSPVRDVCSRLSPFIHMSPSLGLLENNDVRFDILAQHRIDDRSQLLDLMYGGVRVFTICRMWRIFFTNAKWADDTIDIDDRDETMLNISAIPYSTQPVFKLRNNGQLIVYQDGEPSKFIYCQNKDDERYDYTNVDLLYNGNVTTKKVIFHPMDLKWDFTSVTSYNSSCSYTFSNIKLFNTHILTSSDFINAYIRYFRIPISIKYNGTSLVEQIEKDIGYFSYTEWEDYKKSSLFKGSIKFSIRRYGETVFQPFYNSGERNLIGEEAIDWGATKRAYRRDRTVDSDIVIDNLKKSYDQDLSSVSASDAKNIHRLECTNYIIYDTFDIKLEIDISPQNNWGWTFKPISNFQLFDEYLKDRTKTIDNTEEFDGWMCREQSTKPFYNSIFNGNALFICAQPDNIIELDDMKTTINESSSSYPNTLQFDYKENYLPEARSYPLTSYISCSATDDATGGDATYSHDVIIDTTDLFTSMKWENENGSDVTVEISDPEDQTITTTVPATSLSEKIENYQIEITQPTGTNAYNVSVSSSDSLSYINASKSEFAYPCSKNGIIKIATINLETLMISFVKPLPNEIFNTSTMAIISLEKILDKNDICVFNSNHDFYPNASYVLGLNYQTDPSSPDVLTNTGNGSGTNKFTLPTGLEYCKSNITLLQYNTSKVYTTSGTPNYFSIGDIVYNDDESYIVKDIRNNYVTFNKSMSNAYNLINSYKLTDEFNINYLDIGDSVFSITEIAQSGAKLNTNLLDNTIRISEIDFDQNYIQFDRVFDIDDLPTTTTTTPAPREYELSFKKYS